MVFYIVLVSYDKTQNQKYYHICEKFQERKVLLFLWFYENRESFNMK